MSFDKGRHAATSVDQPVPVNQRTTFLDVLRLELQETWGVRSGVVLRQGCTVLFAVNSVPATKSVEIGCDMTPDGWWFSWAQAGRKIAPVDDSEQVAALIAGHLRG